MNFIKNKLLSGIVIFGLITNLLVLFDIQYLYLRAIFSFIFLITIPGLFIMMMLEIREIGFWEYLLYTIGLSIAFLMFGGLFTNWTLPLVGIDKPLSLVPLFVIFNIFLLIFWFIVFTRNKEITLKIKLPKLDWLNKIFFITPVIFPLLSILGAITLNNRGPNYLTMIMLGGIAVYVFLTVLSRHKLNDNIYPWSIFIISISLLLMYSLRSWHISGFDIQQEFQVFQATKENFHWSMLNFQDAYNACLSITILPTIFSWFLNLNDQYIFKLIFPLIFSFVPLGVYLFLKRYTKSIFAFIAGFFFISQQWFITAMPALARQEIAFLFFTLSLLILFNKEINLTIKKSLFLIFGFSMVISHYSTTYIALALFIFTYLACLFFRKTENIKTFLRVYEKLKLKEKWEKYQERKYYISGILIILLVIFSFFWYSQLTKTSGNLIDFTHRTIQNIGKIFTGEIENIYIIDALFSKKNAYTNKDVEEYYEDITINYKKNGGDTTTYDSKSYQKYKIYAIYPQNIPFIHKKISSIVNYFYKLITNIIKLFFLIGGFYIFFIRKQKTDIEYKIMVLIFIFLIGIMIFTPYVSTGYNFERFYQQALIVLSLPAVLGSLFVFKSLKENKKITLTALIFISFFFIISGFLYTLFGGEAGISLNNFGENYDKFYIHKTEVKSIDWCLKFCEKKNKIYLDKYTNLRFYIPIKLKKMIILDRILPTVIDQNAYVYSSYTNVVKNRVLITYKSKEMSYNFPTEFLNDNKNKIYNNGGSEIFK